MNLLNDQAWRRATAILAVLLGVLVVFATIVVLGWWLWEFVIDDVDAIPTIPRRAEPDRLHRLAAWSRFASCGGSAAGEQGQKPPTSPAATPPTTLTNLAQRTTETEEPIQQT